MEEKQIQMEKLEKELAEYSTRFQIMPMCFVGKTITFLKKNPYLLDKPNYKELYAEFMWFLEWTIKERIKLEKWGKMEIKDFLEVFFDFTNEIDEDYAFDKETVDEYIKTNKK